MSSAPTPRPGQRFRDITVVRLLARGGMAEVLEVVGRHGRRYALKVLQRRWTHLQSAVDRMVHEGAVLVGMKHRYIVEAHDCGVHEGVPWVLMDLIDGYTLREEIATRDVMSVPFVCALLRSAAYAVHQCHLIGIIHRDIKPENFMVPRVPRDDPPYVKLIDLGVAHIFKDGDTQGQGPIGTPLYMAPEQFNTRLPVTEATDVYSLGVMAYEMLAGVHPFQLGEKALTGWQLCFEHSYTSPPPLSTFGVAQEISDVVAAAMEKHPLRRLASAKDFGDALWAGGKGVRDRESAEDTHAGEPASSTISVPNVLDVRTGPLGVPARRAGTSRPVAHVQSGPLPPEMADPAAVETFLHAQAAARGGPAAPQTAPLPLSVQPTAPLATSSLAERSAKPAPLQVQQTTPLTATSEMMDPRPPLARSREAAAEVRARSTSRASTRWPRLAIGVGLGNAALVSAVLLRGKPEPATAVPSGAAPAVVVSAMAPTVVVSAMAPAVAESAPPAVAETAPLPIAESALLPVADSALLPVAESATPPVAESAAPPVAAQAPPRPAPAGTSKPPARRAGSGDRRAAGAPSASASAVASASPAPPPRPAGSAPPRPF